MSKDNRMQCFTKTHFNGYNLNDIFIIIGCAVDVTHHAWKNFKVWWYGVIKGGFYHIIEVHTF